MTVQMMERKQTLIENLRLQMYVIERLTEGVMTVGHHWKQRGLLKTQEVHLGAEFERQGMH